MSSPRRVSALSRHRCEELLASADVGRVVADPPPGPGEAGAGPLVYPVAFVLDAGAVVFRTAGGSRLARAADGPTLTFQVDSVSPRVRAGWSVLVTGAPGRVTDEAERARLGRRLQAWAPGPKDVFVRIPLEEVTGREVDQLPAPVVPASGRAPAAGS